MDPNKPLDDCIERLKECHAECRTVGAAPTAAGAVNPATVALIIQSLISILQAIRDARQNQNG